MVKPKTQVNDYVNDVHFVINKIEIKVIKVFWCINAGDDAEAGVEGVFGCRFWDGRWIWLYRLQWMADVVVESLNYF
ncbi:hypothetical protein DPMN_073311 [Dreissena polymorpha]|uniref:Uncharacterized protein n=1 Tax=Dreissena polymorpha TaxID=45954 RepID=A0A9D4HAT9_DREPO|nr:hypothetical protein DPMN_073311 [Dreissena polymorpha]